MAGYAPHPGENGPVRLDRRGASVHLVLDDEKNRNRLSTEVLHALQAALGSAARLVDEGVRVVVLESSSRRVFSAGADLSEMGALAAHDDAERLASALPALIDAMRRCPLPVVARVDGLCLAGGVGLVLAADLVVCSDTAVFGLPEVDVGLWPFIVSALLTRHCSPKRAMDMMLTAEWIDAGTAHESGLVSRVVAAAELDAEMERLISTVSEKPAPAVSLGKSAFYATAALPPDLGLEYARGGLASSLGDPAVRRRIAAHQAAVSSGPPRARNGGAP
ncbi:enoyl-CoA hydratase/isomerase family protein [Actinomadura sp. 3N407]|uniref:enoyl-CoA hydratase/isomerase family protein n=1 Tax=Actinomadura sp. 3N407 TaxID=3457423 RepID=UPI003FCCC663